MLDRARLYLVCDARPEAWLRAAIRGGVDVVQLRDKALEHDEDAIRRAAEPFRDAAEAEGALFILNDRPDLVEAVGADGVHVGQADMPANEARALVGPDRIVGLSSHAPAQMEAAAELPIDYLVAGPVHATPTKPGRPATGLAYIEHVAAHWTATPWFAIGGLNAANVQPVLDAGASRVVVVRAITEAPDPEPAARVLRALLEDRVGAAQ